MDNPTDQDMKGMLAILALVLVVTAGVFFFLLTRAIRSSAAAIPVSDQTLNPYTAVAETATNESGSIQLKTNTSQTTISMTDPLTLIAYGTSPTVISGYDVVIQYDDSLVSYVSSESLLQDFQLITTTEPGAIIATGIKNLQAPDGEVFSHTPLSIFTFKAKKRGKVTFHIVYTKNGTDDSNLIDKERNDVLKIVEGVTVEIK